MSTEIITTNAPPREGGTVIMATGSGATPSPTTPAPGPTVPNPGVVEPVAPVTDSAASATSPLINPPAPTNVGAAALSAVVPVAPPPVAVEIKTTSTTEKVGLLECDTYVDRYSRCITRNVPTNQQASLVQGLETSIRRWQSMATTAAGRTDAANECQRAFDQTRQAMNSYSCAWE